MPVDHVKIPYKVGLATATTAIMLATSTVNASCIPSKFYKVTPVAGHSYSSENAYHEDYITINDTGELFFHSSISQSGLYDLKWLSKALEQDQLGHSDEALDIIFDNIDVMLLNGNFNGVDNLLVSVDPTEHSLDMALGLLTSTLPAKFKLENRNRFYELVKEDLIKHNALEEGLLVGLD